MVNSAGNMFNISRIGSFTDPQTTSSNSVQNLDQALEDGRLDQTEFNTLKTEFINNGGDEATFLANMESTIGESATNILNSASSTLNPVEIYFTPQGVTSFTVDDDWDDSNGHLDVMIMSATNSPFSQSANYSQIEQQALTAIRAEDWSNIPSLSSLSGYEQLNLTTTLENEARTLGDNYTGVNGNPPTKPIFNPDGSVNTTNLSSARELLNSGFYNQALNGNQLQSLIQQADAELARIAGQQVIRQESVPLQRSALLDTSGAGSTFLNRNDQEPVQSLAILHLAAVNGTLDDTVRNLPPEISSGLINQLANSPSRENIAIALRILQVNNNDPNILSGLSRGTKQTLNNMISAGVTPNQIPTSLNPMLLVRALDDAMNNLEGASGLARRAIELLPGGYTADTFNEQTIQTIAMAVINGDAPASTLVTLDANELKHLVRIVGEHENGAYSSLLLEKIAESGNHNTGELNANEQGIILAHRISTESNAIPNLSSHPTSTLGYTVAIHELATADSDVIASALNPPSSSSSTLSSRDMALLGRDLLSNPGKLRDLIDNDYNLGGSIQNNPITKILEAMIREQGSNTVSQQEVMSLISRLSSSRDSNASAILNQVRNNLTANPPSQPIDPTIDRAINRIH